jgi:hypothetical protein
MPKKKKTMKRTTRPVRSVSKSKNSKKQTMGWGFLSKFNKPVLFVLGFALVGAFILFTSMAATKTLSYSGKLGPVNGEQKSYQITTSSGIIATELKSRSVDFGMKITAEDGTVLSNTITSTKNRNDFLYNLEKTVEPGTYNVVVYLTKELTKDVNYSINISYPSEQPVSTEGPAVVITEPTLSEIKGNITISANVTSSVSVNKVDFYVDGNIIGSDNTSPYSYAWDSKTVIDGSHTLSVIATDSNGKTGTAAISTNVVNTVSSTPPSLTCEGYPEKRVFLESQAWWIPPSEPNTVDNAGHVHVGACFPLNQKVAGKINFKLRVVMHDNPGFLNRYSVAVAGYGKTEVTFDSKKGPKCAEVTCTWWFDLEYDTVAQGVPDGVREFRIHAQTRQPNGNTMFPSTGWNAVVNNSGTTTADSTSKTVEGRGWYGSFSTTIGDFGYQNAALKTPYPLEPVKGLWTPTLNFGPGSGGQPSASFSAHIDPNFHMGNPGQIIASWDKTLNNLSSNCKAYTYNDRLRYDCKVPIDTTKLSNGLHRLVLKTDSKIQSTSLIDNNALHSGLMVMPFTVQN